jgi:ankyrin repeat protein
MLLMAAIGGIENPEVYDLILEQNISIHYKNTSGANALLLLSAAPIKSTAILHYFISKNVALDSADNDGNNLFFYAAKGGQLPTMKFWKANGVTTSYRNTKGENAVLFAARGMRRQTLDLEVFKYLSEDLNIEVDQVNYEGQTPLHFSARSTNTELFDFFLQAGVSANQVDKNGNIALTNAASGFKNNLEKIAVATSDINHKNNLGESAITIAITKGRKDHFDFLLSKGADLGITDALGNDLMYYVFKSFSPKNEDLTQYFIKRLKAYGLNGKSLYTNNNTLAHIAIEKHSVFLLEQAIAMGTNINLKNTTNLSPLHLAAMKAKNKTIINVLLEHGVEKNTRTEFNESPYDLALQNELLRAKNIDLTVLKTN